MTTFDCPKCEREYSDRTTEDEVRALRAKRNYEETGFCSDDCEAETTES
jgi:hypothetical protein